MSNVQIPQRLFLMLVMYHLGDMHKYDDEISVGLQKKLDTIITRNLYVAYKTAPTEAEREKARCEYLDKVGIPQAFRW